MSDNDAEPASLGLRERKKLMTRQAILDVAEEMFAERGFDNVTVAEIADAVNISAKTVFVYFPAKEDLVFDGESEMRDLILASIRDRAANETPLDAMGAFLHGQITAAGPGAVTGLDRLRRTVGESTVLNARLRLMWEHFELAIADLLAEETGQPATAPEPRVAAAQLILVFRLLASEEVLTHLRSRPKSRRRGAMVNWLDESLRLVGTGLADYAPRAE
ncbi:MAG TPA: TetR family transcriptional regulator [Pseudonocardiaceae bacterium]|jgi:AcrR family transcriptional regulator|nr:TetR family transcriptional regulator [Pseudonocardiaceae bacterium]